MASYCCETDLARCSPNMNSRYRVSDVCSRKTGALLLAVRKTRLVYHYPLEYALVSGPPHLLSDQHRGDRTDVLIRRIVGANRSASAHRNNGMSHTPTDERGERGGRRDVCSVGATRQATPAFWQADLEIACVKGSPGQRVESGFHTARTRTAIHFSHLSGTDRLCCYTLLTSFTAYTLFRRP